MVRCGYVGFAASVAFAVAAVHEWLYWGHHPHASGAAPWLTLAAAAGAATAFVVGLVAWEIHRVVTDLKAPKIVAKLH